jgi:nucleoside-diphosphate-sugar epimerase
MRIVITGAAGQIASQLLEELSCDHDLSLIDRRPVFGRQSIIGDLSMRSGGWRWLEHKSARWSDVFAGAQVVVHLAADSAPAASWGIILPNNIQATFNVLQAASDHGVRRVVFASSNWAVKALEQKLAPDCYGPDGVKIDSETPPFPLTAYGLSKGFGELAGKMFVDEVVRARWIGVEDTRSLFRRCVEADIKGFHVVYGVSAQKTAPYDLSHTQQLLSWFPRQIPDDQPIRRREPT